VELGGPIFKGTSITPLFEFFRNKKIMPFRLPVMKKNTQQSSVKRRMVELFPEFYLRKAYTLRVCQPVVNNKSSELVIEPLAFDITMHF
jgi:hypothetical protein